MSRILSYAAGISTALQVAVGTTLTYAAEYGGGGLNAGAGDAGAIVGATDVRGTVIEIIKKVLSYMALAAVAVIVIAGILLIFSGGNDESKERAKRIVLFAIAGLIVILLARGLVQVMAELSTSN